MLALNFVLLIFMHLKRLTFILIFAGVPYLLLCMCMSLSLVSDLCFLISYFLVQRLDECFSLFKVLSTCTIPSMIYRSSSSNCLCVSYLIEDCLY